jgi:peroxiredoxin
MRDALRTAALGAIVVVLAFAYAHLAHNPGPPLELGREAPGFRLPTLGGGEAELSSWRGRVVVLNFWATWCPPCVAEMPSLERLHRALGPEGLAVVTVSTDEDEEAVEAFVRRHGLTLPVLLDPAGRVAAQAYRVSSYPQSFVLDRHGVLLGHYEGPVEWDTPEARAHFRGLLAETPAAAPGAAEAQAGIPESCLPSFFGTK